MAVYLGALVGLLAVAAVAALMAVADHRRVVDEQRELQAIHLVVDDLVLALVDQQTGVRGYVIADDRSFLAPYAAGRVIAAERLAELESFAADARLDGIAGEVATARRRIAAWQDHAEAQIARVMAGDRDLAIDMVRSNHGVELFAAVRDQTDVVDALIAAEGDQLDDDLARGEYGTAAFALGGLVLGLILATVAFVDIRRRGTRPLARLAVSVEDVAGGHLERTIPIAGATEIRTVAEGVDSMRHRLLTEIDAAVRRSVLAAEATERSRLAGELHDDAVQAVYAASVRLTTLAARVRDDPELSEPLAETTSSLNALQERLRSLMFVLSPPSLASGGLAAALEDLADELFAGTRSDVDVRVESRPGATQAVDAMAFRLVAEAARNSAKHAGADHVAICVTVDAAGVTGHVTDDGCGFDDDGGATRGHHGLGIARALADAVGGWFSVTSRAGDGTDVTFWVPAPGPASPAS